MGSMEHVYSNLSADDLNSEPTEIESLCMNCNENGMTKLLLTKIPHYKEIILMSFNCEQCGFSNNEIQSGSAIQEKGLKLTVIVAKERDLSRQLVKSDYATIVFPELELEIPPKGQKGEITTIEGVLQKTIAGLDQDQPVRRHMDPEGAQQIDDYIKKIRSTLELSCPFTIVLDDPSGNSFIENPNAPGPDEGRTSDSYVRSPEQNHSLGLYTEDELKTADDPVLSRDIDNDDTSLTSEKLKEEVLSFPTNCHDCNAPAETNMKMTTIPYFKEVIIMATVCDVCGTKTNEVKSGGGIEEKGKKITLRVTDPSDMSRDVLKSETCSIAIPELDFEMGGMALGGRFTTLEGLLNNILDSIEENSVWGGGDGVAPDVKERMNNFKLKFQDCLSVKSIFTLVLDDPAGNSYMQNVYAPEEDPELTVETYERSYDQNEDLGLNDMKVENYEES